MNYSGTYNGLGKLVAGVAYRSMKLGKWLKAYRKRAELTQAQLSELTKVPQGTISRLEKDVDQPSLETLAALSQGLGVTVDDILRAAGVVAPVDAQRALGGATEGELAEISRAWIFLPNALRQVLLSSIRAYEQAADGSQKGARVVAEDKPNNYQGGA